MRIIKISDMTDKEKEQWQKQLVSRQNEREENRRNEMEKANALFESTVGNNKQNVNLPVKSSNNMLPPVNRVPYNAQESMRQISNNRINLPVAQDFQKQLETGKRVEPSKEYSLPVFIDKAKNSGLNAYKYIGKKTGTGALQGTTGIAQAGITDIANNFEKGKQKSASEVGQNIVNSFTGILNPVSTFNNAIGKLPTLIGNTVKTVSDKSKNPFEKVVSLGMNAVSEGLNDNSIRNIFNSVTQGVGKILPENSSDMVMNFNNKISEPVNRLNQQLEEERQEHGQFVQTLGDVGQVVGNMVPAIAGTTITKNPTVGLTAMGLSTKGQATQEALNKGATLDEAVKIGDTKAMIEVGTEMLTGGVNIFGKGALDEIIEKGIDKKVKNTVANFLIKKGLDIPGEVIEETISDVLGTAIDKGTIDPNASYSLQDWGNTAITTTLSTVVLNALTGGYSKKAYLQNKNSLNEVNKQSNSPMQQINQEQNKMAQNQNMEQTNIPIRNYQYQATDNAKINNLRQDMSKYWRDTKEIKALGSVIEKIIEDKGYNIRLDDTLNKNGKPVNAQITTLDNGEIEMKINPNSKKVGEFLIMHETTHAIGTQEMKDLVMDYASKNKNFNQALESLKQTYGVEDVSDEVLSDISGQLFGDQEFINNLSIEKPNVFKRIYNKIIELANKFTGNSRYDLFVKDLKNKWEEAYRTQSNNLNNNSYFSIQQDSNGNKYVKVDTDQNIFDGIDKKDYNKIAKMYMQDYLEGNTKLSKNSIVKIGNKGISKYTNPQQQRNYMSEKMKLSTELKNVLEIAEKVADSSPSKDTSKFPNWEYYKVSFEIGGKPFEGLINIGIDKNGNKHFYEINKIHTTSNSYVSTSKSSSTDSINNSILPTKEDVNRNTTKYSMQNNINNTQQNIVETEQMKQYTVKKLFKLANSYKVYRGISENGNTGTALYGEGLYVTTNKKYASQFGNVIEIDKGQLPENPLQFKTEIDFSQWEKELANSLGIPKNKLYNNDNVDKYIKKLGYDGLTVGTGKDMTIVKYFNKEYSLPTKEWSKHLNENYKPTGTRTNLEDIKLPRRKYIENNTQNSILPSVEQPKNYRLPVDENIQNKQLNNNVNFPPTEKQRKHYKSIIESQYTTDEAKRVAKELMGTDTYVPESNNKQLKTADSRIEISGADNELNSLKGRVVNGERMKAEDVAVGERLIQYYSKTGDKIKLQDAIQTTAMIGTQAGQTVQAMSLLNHQTPEGQAIWLQRSVEKMNNELKRIRGEKAEQFNITPEMTEKIVNSKNTEALQNNLNEVYKELGQQVSKTTAQKIDAWRYFAMLANPRTHIRNMVGNTAMGGMQYGIKNKIAGGIEAIVSKVNPNMERNHTAMLASKQVKEFAKADIKNVADRLGLNENKYNPKSRLENSMRTFRSDIMENTIGKAFEFNDNALEAEDGWGLKSGYTKSLAEYMTANKLTPENITDKQLAKARNYAVEQAKQATFHQDSQLASLLNQLSNKNKFSKFVMDATLPFKKTPINVAKSGIEYSSVGLAKSIVYDTAQLRKGNITINQYIDNISKGLTGTGITLVGYALASCGVLKASGSDDDKGKYDEARGEQTYSIKVGDNTYSLDWIAPSGIPLFIGAECYEIMQNQKNEKTSYSNDDESDYEQAIKTATNILDAFTNVMNPMTEMSMLSGITSSLKSYDQGSSAMFANMGTNAVKSYVNQFLPTSLGYVAKSMDKYERSTTSTKTGVLPKAIDTTKKQMMSKLPVFREMLPVKTDSWGNEMKQSENVVFRTLENSVFPWTRKEVSSTAVDKELINLYNKTGESSILPDTINKNMTIDKQKYVLTSDEYAKYKKEYGETSYDLLNNLVKTQDYRKLTDIQKQKAIESVYSYAKEQIKVDYANENMLYCKTSNLFNTMQYIVSAGGNESEYLNYIAKTTGVSKEKEKNEILAKSSYSEKTKKAIYVNTTGKDDKIYELIQGTGINMTEYLKYKTQEFESDKDDDGTLKGKAVSNSKQEKVIKYLNSMKITGNQRLLLYAINGYKTTTSQKKQVADYVYGLKMNKDDKLKLYSKFSGFTVYKDGRVKW